MKKRILTATLVAAAAITAGLAGATGVAAAASAGTAVAARPAASPGGTWGPAQAVNGVISSTYRGPGGYTPASGVFSISCATAGNCGAIGEDNSGAFVINEVNGVWGQPMALPGVPSFDLSNGINSISCATPGNCTVGGTTSLGNGLQAFFANEVHGTWRTAQLVSTALLGDAKDNVSIVESFACGAPGDCAAGGFYQTSAGSSTYQMFAVAERNGDLEAARPEPDGAYIDSMSCAPHSDYCAATVDWGLLNGNDSAPWLDHVIAEKNGSWGKEEVIGGLSGLGARASWGSISCGGAGECTLTGVYTTTVRGATHPFVASETKGSWGRAVKLKTPSLPAGATRDSVSCSSPGNCLLTGQNAKSFFFTATERNGTWGPLQTVPGLPAGADVQVISCPSAGNCAIGGSYGAGAQPEPVAFVASQSNGTWHRAHTVDIPSLGYGNSVTALSCPQAGYCSAAAFIADSCVPVSCVSTITQQYVVDEATASSMSLRLSAATLSYGDEQAERLTVTVTSPARGNPAGTVTVAYGGEPVCTIALKWGKGACVLTAEQLATGIYHLTATYSGSQEFLGSTSAAKTLTIAG